MTGKDSRTISCTHLMVKLSVLAGRKIILKGEVVTTPASVDEGQMPHVLATTFQSHMRYDSYYDINLKIKRKTMFVFRC